MLNRRAFPREGDLRCLRHAARRCGATYAADHLHLGDLALKDLRRRAGVWMILY